jgi:6-phosphogluconolactonase
MQRVACLLVAFASNFCAQADFLYVNNQVDSTPNNIVGYHVRDDASVALLPGAPFPTGGLGAGGGLFAVRRIVATSSGHLFAVNGNSQSISAFSINPNTGALTPVPGSPFATNNPYLPHSTDISVAVSNDEKFLFAASQVNGQLSVFTIAASGALQPVPGSPFPILKGMDGMEITPDGHYLAVAQLGSGISVFRISREDGSAAFVTTYPELGPGSSAGLACNCAGTHLFVAKANYLNETILGVYNLNNGILNPVPG